MSKSLEDLINEALEASELQEIEDEKIRPESKQVKLEIAVSSEENKDGAAGIKDGKLIVRYPKGMGKYPSITKSEGTKILVNNEEVDGTLLLTEDLQVEVLPDNEKPESIFEITISPDELEAYLTIRIKKGRTFRLLDQEQSLHLIPTAEIVEEINPKPIKPNLVTEKLKTLGIIFGIDLRALLKEIQSPTGKKIVIAKGQPPVPSQDAYIEYFFDNKTRIQREIEPGERVDYKDRGVFQAVDAGTVIGIKHPPVPGRNGISVTGKELPVQPPVDKEILCGEGVCLVNEGLKAVTTISGRPVLVGKNKVVKVFPELDIPGNVDINTGHVYFKGDVKVRGSVLEGLTVRATGRVTVMGNVYSATIIAGENVIICGNLIGGTVIAGGESAFLSRVSPVLSHLKSLLPKLVGSVLQLKSNSMFSIQDLKIKGDGSLIKLLIDMKFKEIPKLVEKLNHYLNAVCYKPSDQIYQCVELLNAKLFGMGPLDIQTIDELAEIQEVLKDTVSISEDVLSQASDVIVKYSQNSLIEATGAITVSGQGIYHTNMYAGREINVNGICRGGEICAGGNMVFSELGSASAVVTRVETSVGKEIRAKTAFPNVFLKIGRQGLQVRNTVHNMRCFENDTKMLVLQST